MDWIHCNACWIRPIDAKNSSFSITSCGHIFCDACVKAGSTSGSDKCKACGRECSRRVLDADVGTDIQQFFTDPREIVKKAVDVLSFQIGHKERLASYLFGVVAKYKILKKEVARMSETITSTQKKLKALEKENFYLKQKLSRMTTYQTSQPSQQPTFFLSPSQSQSPSPTAAPQNSPSMGPPVSLFPRRSTSQSQFSPYFSKLITSSRLSLRQNKPSSNTPPSQSFVSPSTAVNGYRVANIGTPITPGTANNSPVYFDSQSPRTPTDVNYIRSGRATPQSLNFSPALMDLNKISLNAQQKTNVKTGTKYFQTTIT